MRRDEQFARFGDYKFNGTLVDDGVKPRSSAAHNTRTFPQLLLSLLTSTRPLGAAGYDVEYFENSPIDKSSAPPSRCDQAFDGVS